MPRQYQEICDTPNAAKPKYRITSSVGEYPAIKQVRFEASVWDPENWPESDQGEEAIIIKKNARNTFLLTNNDMMRLGYTKGRIYTYETKCYNVQEVERLAWEKYGGPSGLKAAQEAKYPTAWRKAGKKTVRATESSRSKTATSHPVAGPSKGPGPGMFAVGMANVTHPQTQSPEKKKKIKGKFVPKVEGVIEID